MYIYIPYYIQYTYFYVTISISNMIFKKLSFFAPLRILDVERRNSLHLRVFWSLLTRQPLRLFTRRAAVRQLMPQLRTLSSRENSGKEQWRFTYLFLMDTSLKCTKHQTWGSGKGLFGKKSKKIRKDIDHIKLNSSHLLGGEVLLQSIM